MPFINCLENLGLKDFVRYKGQWSDEVVKAFYTNFNYNSGDKLFTSEVRGTKILITEEKLAEIIGIPPPDADALRFTDSHHSLTSLTQYSKEDTYRTINREVEFSGYTIKINEMDVNDRVLLNVITHVFVNKPGNWAGGSESEFFMMACILKGIYFNLPYFIMQRMSSCAAREKSPLPYAGIVSKVVKHCSINHRFNIITQAATYIDKHSLKRMNFEFVDNQWVRASENQTMKRARERRERAGEDVGKEGEGEAGEAEEAIAAAGPSTSDQSGQNRMLHDLLDNSNQMLTMMSSMNTRLSLLEDASATQASDIQEIKDMIRDLQQH